MKLVTILAAGFGIMVGMALFMSFYQPVASHVSGKTVYRNALTGDTLLK